MLMRSVSAITIVLLDKRNEVHEICVDFCLNV